MKMNKTYIAALMLSALTALPSQAWPAPLQPSKEPPQTLRLAKKHAKGGNPEGEKTLLDRVIRHEAKRSPFAQEMPFRVYSAKQKAAAPMAAAAADRKLWGCMYWQATWDPWNSYTWNMGLFEFNTTAPVNVNLLYKDDYRGDYLQGDAGAAIVNGVYHCLHLKTTDYTQLSHTAYDIATGQLTTIGTSVDDLSMAALETAQDVVSGTVWGIFYTSDLKHMELGVADYNTMTRTTIAQVKNIYVALGISDDGTLYGVATDGNLYTIDKKNGAETKVGPTGLTLETSDGRYSLQGGEIDQTTNTFYWDAVDSTGVAALYTVDLATGAATKVSGMPTNDVIVGIVVPQAAADADAPAQLDSIAVGFDKGSLTGHVGFTAPTKSVGGDALDTSKPLAYKLYVNGDLKEEGNATPGQAVQSKEMTLDEGMAKFTVALTNEAGKGPLSTAEKFIGMDAPKPVSGLKLDLDKATGRAKLSWSAPKEGVNGGYISDKITYDVVRYPDNKKVATGLADTTFAETIAKSSLTLYSYGVTAHSGEKASAEARSGQKALGDAIVPPYSETFDSEEAFEMFTAYDANDDGKTFVYYPDLGTVRYRYGSQVADDWLFTPKIKLEKGKFYYFDFTAGSGSNLFPEVMEVKYGSAADPQHMTSTLLEKQTMPGGQNKFSKIITADKDMDVVVGFHVMSDPATSLFLDIYDIAIEKGRSMTVPGKPTGLKAVANADGELSATVSLKAPALDYKGDALKSITKLELLRGDSIVKTFDNVQPGQSLSFDDKLQADGVANWAARAWNADGQGIMSDTVAAYVGIDTPLAPLSPVAKDMANSVDITWKPVPAIGAHGGVVKPEGVKYRVYNVLSTDYGTSMEYVGLSEGTSYNVEMNTNEGEQSLLQFAIDAYNDKGESDKVATPSLIKGAPYALPYDESFKAGQMKYPMWWITRRGDAAVEMATDIAADNDGGAVKISLPAKTDSLSLNSGKIALAGAANPQLLFSHFGEPGVKGKLEVIVATPDGTEAAVQTIDYSKLDGEAKWNKASVSLAEFADLPYVIVKFRATQTSSVAQTFYIDAVNIYDRADDDLAVWMEAPAKSVRGQKNTVRVTVENRGMKPASGYNVALYAGKEQIANEKADEALQPLDSRVFELEYVPSVFGKDKAEVVKAEIDYSADAFPDNNAATDTVALSETNLPMPENVKAQNSANATSLTWSKPSDDVASVSDDFDSYDPWLTNDFGGWTTRTATDGVAGKLINVLTVPNEGEPYAFMVFNGDVLYPGFYDQLPIFAPHSGMQMLISPFKQSSDGTSYMDNDDWLISPTLSGRSQTVSFWARAINEEGSTLVNKFEVLASKTGRDAASFEKVGETHEIQAGEWTEVTVALPEGTKYFAIRNVTDMDNSFALAIDDATYEKGAPTLTGFNVYRDGKRLATLKAADTAYTDADAQGQAHAYAVTALYADGESAPAEATTGTGIDGIDSGKAAAYDVYTVDGQLVGKGLKSTQMLRRGVYIVNGKKITVK